MVVHANDDGLSPLDVASPGGGAEFDDRIITVPFSLRMATTGDLLADPERCARVAGLAVRHTAPPGRPSMRVALVFSAHPTKHARIGSAVGLDTGQRGGLHAKLMRADIGWVICRVSNQSERRGDSRVDPVRRAGPD